MGIFKKIKKKVTKTAKKAVSAVKHPVATVKKVAQNPARYTAAVLSGGTSELVRQIPVGGDAYAKLFDQVYAPLYNQAANYYSYGISGQVQSALAPKQPTTMKGEAMAVNLGGLLGSVGTILTRTNQTNNPYVAGLGALTSLAGAAVYKEPKAPTAAMTSLSQPSAMTVAQRQQLSNTGGGLVPVDVVSAGMVLLGKLGIPITDGRTFIPALKKALSALASFARRTPAGSIVSVLIGMGLTGVAANSLVAWYATKRKHRRMNPANSKALRRAARRIKSFHRLCQHTDLIKTRRRTFGGKRCGTCRTNPCAC